MGLELPNGLLKQIGPLPHQLGRGFVFNNLNSFYVLHSGVDTPYKSQESPNKKQPYNKQGDYNPLSSGLLTNNSRKFTIKVFDITKTWKWTKTRNDERSTF